MDVKRADWVSCKSDAEGAIGLVRRVARDGSWADVRWHCCGEEYTKRMPTSALVVRHTIPAPWAGAGYTVTDCMREAEMA